MQFPDSQIEITVKDRKFTIDYPNTGQLIDIERMKATIAGGRYESIAKQGSNSSTYSKFLIDMTSFFNVLCPQLIESLKVSSLLELKAQDSNMLLRIYVKDILPWLMKWEDLLSSDPEETVNEEAGEE